MGHGGKRNGGDRGYRKGQPLPDVRAYRSGHAPYSLGMFAQRFRMRPATLMRVFEIAGIRGLTPNHVVALEEWDALRAYLTGLAGSRTEAIYRETTPVASEILIVQDINDKLLIELARRPQLMYDIESYKFEELVARLLQDQGCDVTMTKRSRDGGYDLFGHMKAGPVDIVFLAECKRYAPQNKVGVEVVRGLYGVTEMQRANLGLVVTSSSFTKDARQEKLRIGSRIELKEFSDLCGWLSAYRKT